MATNLIVKSGGSYEALGIFNSANQILKNIMAIQGDRLTLQEAYLSMFEYLVELDQRTKSDELGAILGDLSLLENGTTADPAAWGDWLKCVEKARRAGQMPPSR